MRPARFLGSCLVLLWAATGIARAHALLQSATPHDGSILDVPPRTLVLQFSEAARLSALWIQKKGGQPQKLAPLPQEPQARITVTLPALAAGDYVVGWRALGDDGHVVPGRIHFTLRP